MSKYDSTLVHPPSQYALAETTWPNRGRCRCGTSLPSGQPHWEFTRTPDIVAGVLQGVPFCSTNCVRAFLLETIEILAATARPESLTVCDDLEELAVALQHATSVLEMD